MVTTSKSTKLDKSPTEERRIKLEMYLQHRLFRKYIFCWNTYDYENTLLDLIDTFGVIKIQLIFAYDDKDEDNNIIRIVSKDDGLMRIIKLSFVEIYNFTFVGKAIMEVLEKINDDSQNQ